MPKGMYSYALNFIRDEYGNFNSEKGTELLAAFPYNYLNHTVIGETVIILAESSGMGYILILDSDNVLTVKYQSELFGWTSTSQVGVEARNNYLSNTLLYITCKGQKVRYINLDCLPTDFEGETGLFLNPKVPLVSLAGVETGGAVKTGVYQASIRLVTASKDRSSAAIFTNPVPVIDDPTSGVSRKAMDGAAPQTAANKLLRFKVDNVDESYTYIEPIIATYIGSENSLQTYSLGLFAITSSTMFFVFDGDYDSLVNIQELVTPTVFYNSAEHVTQKDNVLLLSNLTTEVPTTDYQAIASSIVMRYEVTEIAVDETVEIIESRGRINSIDMSNNPSDYDYVVDQGSAELTPHDYKNAKTCANLKGFRRSEVYAFTFTPIVKGVTLDAYHIPAFDPETSTLVKANTTTKVLGTAPVSDGNLTYSSKFPPKYSGKKVRYHAMPDNLQEPYMTADLTKIRILGIASEITGYTEDYLNTVMDGYIIGMVDRAGNETVITSGIIKPTFQAKASQVGFVPSFGKCTVSDFDNSDEVPITTAAYRTDIVTFYSPEFMDQTQVDINGDSIEQVMEFNAHLKFARSYEGGNTPIKNFLDCSNSCAGKATTTKLYPTAYQINSGSVGEDEANIKIPISFDESFSFEYRKAKDCVLYKADAPLPGDWLNTVDDYRERNGSNSTSETYNAHKHSTVYPVFNIRRERVNYYGNYNGFESIPLKTKLFEVPDLNPATGLSEDGLCHTTIYNGDTFINKVCIHIVDGCAAFGGRKLANPSTSSGVYVWLETTNNYNFRHQDYDDDGKATLPYFPKHSIITANDGSGFLDIGLAIMDNPISYNKHYSAKNLIVKQYSKDETVEVVKKLGNRTIYSAQSTEGELQDSFRKFLSNNYHDIPKERGVITDVFVLGDTLYHQTEFGLWREYFNEKVSQSTTAGAVYMGSGGAFPLPSKLIVDVDGGYAGCSSKFNAIVTPFGRYFVDSIQRKLFMLKSDGQLSFVEDVEFGNFYKDNLASGAFTLGYDYGNKRFMFTKSGEFTLTHQPNLGGFTSFHTYNPSAYISRGPEILMIQNGSIHGLTGTECNYFGALIQPTITVPVHEGGRQLTYTVMQYYIDTYLNKPSVGLNKVRLLNDNASTGWNSLRVPVVLVDLESLGTIFTHNIKGQYRFAIPPDVVVDSNSDVELETNLVTNPIYNDEDRLFLPRFSGEFANINLIFDAIKLKINHLYIEYV